MAIPTFGYMAADRTSNAQLFENWRSLAITAFANEQVCDLSSFYEDSMADCDEILSKDDGKKLCKPRDGYFASLEQRRVPIRLPDIQSFFLYAFTLGLNRFGPYCLCRRRWTSARRTSPWMQFSNAALRLGDQNGSLISQTMKWCMSKMSSAPSRTRCCCRLARVQSWTIPFWRMPLQPRFSGRSSGVCIG